MNAGFKVEEVFSQKQRRWSPMKPQMIGSERDKHGSHTEVDPAVLVQGSHAGIDHRIASLSGAPRIKVALAELILAQPIVGTAHVLEFDRGLVLQFLHEVAMPAQT